MTRAKLPSWLAINAAFVYVFLYGPILLLVGLSLNRSPLATLWTGFTLDWYISSIPQMW